MDFDLSLITNIRDNVDGLTSLLALISQQHNLQIELVIIDLGSTRIDYTKVNEFLLKHSNIKLALLRGGDVTHWSVGFRLGAARSSGKVLAFVNPELNYPPDFFIAANRIGLANGVWIPIAWQTIHWSNDNCGFWAVPDFQTLVVAAEHYDKTDATISWRRTPWPIMDGALLAASLATHLPVRLAVMGGLEHKNWITNLEALQQLPSRISSPWFYPTTNTLHRHDIRWHTLANRPFKETGLEFTSAGSRFAVNGGGMILKREIETLIFRLADEYRKHENLQFAETFQQALDADLRKRNIEELPFIPSIRVDSKDGALQIRGGEIVRFHWEEWLV